MPTPDRYDALAAGLHGWRRLAGLSFAVALLLTALCIISFRAQLLPPVRLLRAAAVLLFAVSAWSAGVYVLCDWFEPPEGYPRFLSGSQGRRTGPLVRWSSAIFLDVWFLGALVLTLLTFYVAFS